MCWQRLTRRAVQPNLFGCAQGRRPPVEWFPCSLAFRIIPEQQQSRSLVAAADDNAAVELDITSSGHSHQASIHLILPAPDL